MSVLVRAVRGVGITVVGIGILVGIACVRAVFFAGPDLLVTRDGAAVRVEAVVLEYNLGLEHLVLEDTTAHQTVFEAVSRSVPFSSVVEFTPGPFNGSAALGPEAKVVVPQGGVAELVGGHSYVLTVWGNNGFARTRRSRCRFRL